MADPSVDRQILKDQIGALRKNLERIEDLLNTAKIESKYRGPVSGGFRVLLSRGYLKIKNIEDNFSNLSAAELWKEYYGARSYAQRIFNQCLDWLGGIYVRYIEMEGGICNLAEALVTHLVGQTGAAWSSVLILGDERPYDEFAFSTQILRLQFPQWDVWSLPLIAYEYGQLIAQNSYSLNDLNAFHDQEQERIRHLVSDPELDEKDLPLSSQMEAWRNRYKSGEKAELDQFLVRIRAHLRSLFADAFATYFVGPAYVYAQLFLRLVPTQVLASDADKLAFGRRFLFMKKTLEKLNVQERSGQFEPGPFQTDINRISAYWEQTTKSVLAEHGSTLEDPYDRWFEKTFDNLVKPFSRVGFRKASHEASDRLKEVLRSGESPTVSPEIPIILNAAWLCRMDKREDTEKIAEYTLAMLSATRTTAAQAPASPQTQPKR